MRLVLLSDTHEKHDSVDVPDGDVLVHAGDFTMIGEPAKIVDFDRWLGKLPHPYKIVIPGNHDKIFEKDEKYARSLITNAVVLIDQEFCLTTPTTPKIKFYGLPWTPTFGYGWAYNADSRKMKFMSDKIPNDTDVLISHGPPKFQFDRTFSNDLAGSEPLLERLQQLDNPKVVVFGHIHEGYGSDGFFFNASICDLSYRPTNKPFVVEI